MKFYKSFILPLIEIAAISVQSCDLTEHPTTFVTPDDYYKTELQCEAAINGCYAHLNSIYSSDFMTCTEAVTDLMYVFTNSDDARMKITPSNPSMGDYIWKWCYTPIMRANSVIPGIEGSPIEEEKKPALLAEIKVVRAFYWYILTSFYGDVPFYTFPISDVDTQNKVAKMKRMPASDTRNYLIKELQECVPDMVQRRFSDDKKRRMGAPVGWLLIAKLCMWEHRWDDALDALKQIEKIYGDFSQYPLEDILFRCKNTPESIFEVQRTYTAGGLNVTSNTAAICTPYHHGDANYDGVEIPELGKFSITWTSMRPTVYYYSTLMTKKGSDKRADINLAYAYDGKPFKGAAVTPWLGPKFWCPNMQQTSDHNNNRVFRYADALLMMAECYMEKRDYENSLRYLNMTRNRAGIGDYVLKTPELLQDEIRKERGRELMGEWQRKFDLVRWGIWYQAVLENTGRGEVKTNLRPCHEYYPIPDKQVVYSGGNLDNKEYEKYGL